MRTNKVSQSGFSLIDVIVMMGVLSIVVAGSMAAFMEGQKMLTKLEAKQSIGAVSMQIQSVLATRQSCRTALGISAGGGPTFSTAASDHYTQSGGGLTATLQLKPGETIGAGTAVQGTPLVVNSLKFFDAKRSGVLSGETVYRASLFAQFATSREPTLPMAPQHVGGVFIQVNGSRISDCFALNSNDPESMTKYNQMQCNNWQGKMVNGSCDVLAGLCERIEGGDFNDDNNRCSLRSTVVAAPPAPPRPTTPFIPLPICSGGCILVGPFL